MDSTQGYAFGALLTSLVGISGYLIKLNHKRIRSTCCNIPCLTSIDIEETTPPREELRITIPPIK
jgi:hypothetical protein